MTNYLAQAYLAVAAAHVAYALVAMRRQEAEEMLAAYRAVIGTVATSAFAAVFCVLAGIAWPVVWVVGAASMLRGRS